MQYDSQHNLTSRRTTTSSGDIRWDYTYEPTTGKLARIQSSDGKTSSFSYDAAGNLLSAATPQGTRSYQFSTQGDLTAFSGAGVSLGFLFGRDGQIEQMTENGKLTTRFKYQGTGQLSQVTFSSGVTAQMRYDELGLRRKLSYRDGRSVDYSEDPSGNLIATSVVRLDGSRDGQTLTLDDSYQVTRQTLADGTVNNLEYDRNGNLIRAEFGTTEVVQFEYDSLNRITAAISSLGERLDYQYSPGEPSLIAQYDDHSRARAGERLDSGQTFAPRTDIYADRTEPAHFGAVHFSEALGAFELSGGEEIVIGTARLEEPLRKMRLLSHDGASLHQRTSEFQKPSNIFFMPPEYATINCCPLCCVRGCSCDPCDPAPEPIPTVTIVGPNNVALRAAGSAAPNTIQLTAEPSEPGGTYSWTTTSTRVTLSNTTSQVVTVTSQSQSSSVSDVPIRVSYTTGGGTASATKNITVSKPTSLFLESDLTNPTGKACTNPNYTSYLRTRIYVVQDQFARLFTNLSLNVVDVRESFSAFSSTCGASSPAVGSSPDSRFQDQFFFCSAACLPGGSGCTSSATQTITVNSFTVRTSNVTWTCTGCTITP
jgi:YD repeat-containing protein